MTLLVIYLISVALTILVEAAMERSKLPFKAPPAWMAFVLPWGWLEFVTAFARLYVTSFVSEYRRAKLPRQDETGPIVIAGPKLTPDDVARLRAAQKCSCTCRCAWCSSAREVR